MYVDEFYSCLGQTNDKKKLVQTGSQTERLLSKRVLIGCKAQESTRSLFSRGNDI